MKVKTKNVKPNSTPDAQASSIKHRASLNAFQLLCFSFLSFCFLPSLVGAQIRSEQLDPTNPLLLYLAGTLQDVNTPNVQMQAAKSRSTRPVRSPHRKSASVPQGLTSNGARHQQPQTSDIDAVNLATEVNQKLSQKGFTTNPGSHLGRQLWRAGISFYVDEKDRESKSKLKRIIEQIRSIEFKPPKKTAEPVIVIEPAATVEPNETLSGTEAKEEPEKEAIKAKLSYEPVTDQTLQMVGNLIQHPDQLDNPFELGEVLFFSGHPKEAAVFYQEALKRKGPDKAETAENRAWIMFQIGNCLRNDDLPAAQKMYRRLIAEYPDSPWVYLAKAREELIDWYQKDKPRMLIDECQL